MQHKQKVAPHVLVPARFQELLQLSGRDAVQLIQNFGLQNTVKWWVQLSDSVRDFARQSAESGLPTSLVPLSLMPYLSLVFLIRSEKLLMNFRISCSSAHKAEKK